MTKSNPSPSAYIEALRKSGLSIYDGIEIGDPTLWIPSPELESILDSALRNLSLEGLKLRTRSKVVKEAVCRAIGYPVPKSFKKTQPRFPGQMFDTYAQKANNLQIWNEELSATRRYVLVRVSEKDVVTRVKVVTGDTLALLDTTGTLTQKYQARCIPGSQSTELITPRDTARLEAFVAPDVNLRKIASPVLHPEKGHILSIASVFKLLSRLVGERFVDAGVDQERNRGAALHRLVCAALGYATYEDDGQFPDVRHQLLEVKLQTSPTIDLGLVTPASTEPLDVPMINKQQIRHCDVRYAIFYASISNKEVALTHLFLSTGEGFFARFPQFEGRVLNSKLQIPLPKDFFS
ncbi:hypothetical protein [Reyranella sp.]|uniref:hypothetical protein n=1 Tax=Reyranella sp. TaxID=1929291 RepID=UPI003BAC9552